MTIIYDEEYYRNFCSGQDTYDPLRPVRKALRTAGLQLPTLPTVVIFGFDNIAYVRRWARLFAHLWAYDINPAVIQHAHGLGLDPYFFEQDVSAPFSPCQGEIAVCYYLLEHLNNAQIAQVIANMHQAAHLHIYTITDMDNEHYAQDPTHQNPKSVAGWRAFMGGIYRKMNYRQIIAQNGLYAYWDADLKEATEKAIQPKIHELYNQLWIGMRRHHG